MATRLLPYGNQQAAIGLIRQAGIRLLERYKLCDINAKMVMTPLIQRFPDGSWLRAYRVGAEYRVEAFVPEVVPAKRRDEEVKPREAFFIQTVHNSIAAGFPVFSPWDDPYNPAGWGFDANPTGLWKDSEWHKPDLKAFSRVDGGGVQINMERPDGGIYGYHEFDDWPLPSGGYDYTVELIPDFTEGAFVTLALTSLGPNPYTRYRWDRPYGNYMHQVVLELYVSGGQIAVAIQGRPWLTFVRMMATAASLAPTLFPAGEAIQVRMAQAGATFVLSFNGTSPVFDIDPSYYSTVDFWGLPRMFDFAAFPMFDAANLGVFADEEATAPGKYYPDNTLTLVTNPKLIQVQVAPETTSGLGDGRVLIRPVSRNGQDGGFRPAGGYVRYSNYP